VSSVVLRDYVSAYRSFRNTEFGSWYINAFVKVFMRHVHNMGLCAMLNTVSCKVYLVMIDVRSSLPLILDTYLVCVDSLHNIGHDFVGDVEYLGC